MIRKIAWGLKLVKHRYPPLKMGIIQHYSLIIPKTELNNYLAKGWIEATDFQNSRYYPKPNQTLILSKPVTLAEVNESNLIGQRITAFSTSMGSYGMGGPGFMGLSFSEQPSDYTTLVYAIWGASQYVVLNGREITCHPRYYDNRRPWLSHFADEGVPNWDNLTLTLIGCEVTHITLTSNSCTLELAQNNERHILEFLKNDIRLPPHGNGEPRKDAFSAGKISDYLVFQHEHGVLWV